MLNKDSTLWIDGARPTLSTLASINFFIKIELKLPNPSYNFNVTISKAFIDQSNNTFGGSGDLVFIVEYTQFIGWIQIQKECF